jgi:hypothetical protein
MPPSVSPPPPLELTYNERNQSSSSHYRILDALGRLDKCAPVCHSYLSIRQMSLTISIHKPIAKATCIGGVPSRGLPDVEVTDETTSTGLSRKRFPSSLVSCKKIKTEIRVWRWLRTERIGRLESAFGNADEKSDHRQTAQLCPVEEEFILRPMDL